MGWSYSLFFCQAAFSKAAAVVNPRGLSGLCVERSAAPVVGPGHPVGAVYVDNKIGIGCDRDSGTLVDKCCSLLATADIGTHGDQINTPLLEVLGIVLDFRKGRRHLRHASSRIWRFTLATVALLRRHCVTGELLEIWLGNAAHMSSIDPCILSVLQHAYTLLGSARFAPLILDLETKEEMRTFMHLVFLQVADLGCDWVPVVCCGDSANNG